MSPTHPHGCLKHSLKECIKGGGGIQRKGNKKKKNKKRKEREKKFVKGGAKRNLLKKKGKESKRGRTKKRRRAERNQSEMDSDFGIPRELSDLQKHRSLYEPELPPCLQVFPLYFLVSCFQNFPLPLIYLISELFCF